MTTVYGVQVKNETLGTQYVTTQGEDPDPNAASYLTDPLVVSEGFDATNYPGPLVPGTVQFTIYARTAGDIPPWEAGHVVLVRAVMPEGWSGDWSTTDPDGTSRPPEWVNNRFVLDEPVATPHPGGGLLVSYTGAELLAAVNALPVTLNRTAETFYHRTAALADVILDANGWWDLDITIDILRRQLDVLIDSGTNDSETEVGPVNFTDTPLGEVLAALGYSAVANYFRQSYAEGQRWLRVANVHKETDPTLSYGNDLALSWGWLPRHAQNMATAYRLTQAGTTVPRTPNPSHASGGTMRNVVVDACHVPLDGVSWRHTRGINTVVLGTIATDGSATSKKTAHPAIAAARGVRTRIVEGQLAHTNPLDDNAPALLELLLGPESAAEPAWRPDRVVIETHNMTPAELPGIAQALCHVPGPQMKARLVAQLTVVNVADDWAIASDYLAGTIVATTKTISGGRLSIDCELLPELPQLTGAGGTGYAATFQQVLDAFTPDLTFAGINPTITFTDMQLTGV